jgi:nitroreductase
MQQPFYDLVMTRQSDRGYLDTPVSRTVIERIIEAARMAPSAHNAQPWKFIVVDDTELKIKIAETTTLIGSGMNQFVRQAPVLIVMVMEFAGIVTEMASRIKRKNFSLIDIGIAAEHICLAATAEGLGSCMIGWFDEPAVSRILAIPRPNRPVLIISLGYPDSNHTRVKRRKPLEKILSYNSYNPDNPVAI